jgi:hypothetical protein
MLEQFALLSHNDNMSDPRVSVRCLGCRGKFTIRLSKDDPENCKIDVPGKTLTVTCPDAACGATDEYVHGARYEARTETKEQLERKLNEAESVLRSRNVPFQMVRQLGRGVFQMHCDKCNNKFDMNVERSCNCQLSQAGLCVMCPTCMTSYTISPEDINTGMEAVDTINKLKNMR